MKKLNDQNEIEKLAYELTYHKYLMHKDKTYNLFTELSVSDYIALHSILKITSDHALLDKKAYLKDLADRLELSIHSMSKMASDLQSRGLVAWSHDGDGSEGTYITMTELGIQSMSRQDKILKEYYSRVIQKFGQDNLIHLLCQMEKLEKIMDSEFTCKGGDVSNECDTVE